MFVKCFSEDNPATQQDRVKRNVALANEIRKNLESLGVSNEKILRLSVDLSDVIVDTEIIEGLTKDLMSTPRSEAEAWDQTISDLLGWTENIKTHCSNAIKGLKSLRQHSDNAGA
ncbi:hypothetical protein [Dehalogenimonas etheniformans]|uniref:Uncharacterized protein n=1 Tax=Dehalogenimonas etheniformans TaxID=1536648 RepID=A0A2P5P5S2_9CHLR|nr:hypothetical protein [Dehalogenimonas etheniformans]PPD57648.1 hypothetical protein JP09_007865 [Dehalogenimonas etheniformans]QNT75990.1 hypothetical protein HX448_04450 [Dehalogenimonas etheniformans]